MNKEKIKSTLYDLAWDFNVFCVIVCCMIVVLHHITQIDPEFALFQINLPSFFDGFSEDVPFAPTDFVTP